MKIKTIKKMTLPELIQWGWDNKAIGRFEGDKGSLVLFDANSWVISNKFVCSEETFEVEYLDEITPDTIIPNLAHVWTMNNKPRVTMYHECTIQDFIDDAIEYPSASNEKLMLYMVNDDRTMTLIYKDGGMVE
ncbi:hypothetical protein [Staphylococcus agnetis]|uniref:hypothetical protein n=1 Tax=Staphylococcus agnetis TaxID=985762 RepID=UPI0039EAE90A